MPILAAMALMVSCNKPDEGTSPDYVDLGLPSGTLWTTSNLGAESSVDYGTFLAWGETTATSPYNWETYRYCKGDADQMTKYCNDSAYGFNGFTDNLTVLETADDASTVNYGADWHTPTQLEWQELLDHTENIWTQQNGVNGRLFTAPNGQSLFLPAAGGYWDVQHIGDSIRGYYWACELYTEMPCGAWALYFDADTCFVDYADRRAYGLSIRAVRSRK